MVLQRLKRKRLPAPKSSLDDLAALGWTVNVATYEQVVASKWFDASQTLHVAFGQTAEIALENAAAKEQRESRKL